MISHKQCTHCGELKGTSDFFPNDDNRDGLGSWCKVCFQEQKKAWRQDRLEETSDAENHGEPWTQEQLNIVLNHHGLKFSRKEDKSYYEWEYASYEAARLIGRTMDAVLARRHLFYTDPARASQASTRTYGGGFPTPGDPCALRAPENVCPTCFMTYHGSLNRCPNCED